MKTLQSVRLLQRERGLVSRTCHCKFSSKETKIPNIIRKIVGYQNNGSAPMFLLECGHFASITSSDKTQGRKAKRCLRCERGEPVRFVDRSSYAAERG